MSWPGKHDSDNSAGFTYAEMAFLLLVVALFLVGIVWVVNAAIVKSHPLGKSDTAGRDAERALDKIEALLKTARVFAYDGRALRPGLWTPQQGSLDFLGDLDGDSGTGSYRAGGEKGLERVIIYRQDRSLVVSVKSSPAAPPSTVVLLKGLSPRDQAFSGSFRVAASGAVKITVGTGAALAGTSAIRADRIRVSITTGVGGNRLLLDRQMGLPLTPALAPGRAVP